MRVPNRFILHQAPVLAGLGRALWASLTNRRRGVTPVIPGPELRQTLPPRPEALVRCYVEQVGGEPSAYRHTLPPHLFPQWGFALATQALSVLDYPLYKAVNAGCRMQVHAPLPNDAPLLVRAWLASVDDDGRRALIQTRIVTGTESTPDALVGDLFAHVPLRERGAGGKPKDRPRVPHDARELSSWALSAGAGLAYAKLTGDFNPIHWLPAYAKASGFRNVILHGFATMAYALEGLNRSLFAGDVSALRALDVRFTSPLVLPAKVTLYLSDGDRIMVGDAPGGRAYLTGSFQR